MRRRRPAMWALCLLLGSCGGGGGGGDLPAVSIANPLFIPLFSFVFSGNTDPPDSNLQIELRLAPSAQSVVTGHFEGSSSIKLIYTDPSHNAQYSLTGDFSGCEFDLELDGNVTAPLARSYHGRFSSRDGIVLTATVAGSPPLVLRRDPPDSGSTGCS